MPITKCLVALEPQKPVVQATNGKIEIPGTLSNNITFKLFWKESMQAMQISKWFDIPLNRKNSLWMQKEFVIHYLWIQNNKFIFTNSECR